MNRLLLVIFFSSLFLSGFAQLPDSLLLSKDSKFTHQYRYENDRYYQFIDTSFSTLKWYRNWNNSLSDNFDYSILTNMGGPRNRLTVPNQSNFWDYFDHGAYKGYFLKQGEIPYYYTRSPLTEANYWGGYQRGQVFNIYHTQNVNKYWNFLVKYKRLNSLGFYSNNQIKQSSFLANTHYNNPDWGYQLYTYFLDEKMETQEYGGIVNDTVFEENRETSRIAVGVELENDSRIDKNREFYINQKLKLARIGEVTTDSAQKQEEDKVFLSLGHSFKFSHNWMVYSGNSTGFYDNYFYSSGSYGDSVGYRSYENTFYVTGKVGTNSSLEVTGGVRNLIMEYGNDRYRFRSNNWGVTGKVKGIVSGLVEVDGHLNYAFAGPLANTFDFEGNGAIQLGKKLRVRGGYSFQRKYPELFDLFYSSNNFFWQNNFAPYSLGVLSYGLDWGQNTGLTVTHFNANNWVYYNESSQPTAADKALEYTSIELTQNFDLFGFLHQDNKVAYQIPVANESIMPLPKWVTRNSLYFDFRLFDRALHCLLGAELKYFSAYMSPSYNPATARFYVADEKEIGNYLYADLFAQFQIAKAKIFVKYQNVNQGLSGYDYFAAPHYPMNDRVLRLGITWRFFN